jgi:hypothetical protein
VKTWSQLKTAQYPRERSERKRREETIQTPMFEALKRCVPTEIPAGNCTVTKLLIGKHNTDRDSPNLGEGRCSRLSKQAQKVSDRVSSTKSGARQDVYSGARGSGRSTVEGAKSTENQFKKLQSPAIRPLQST